MSCKIFNCCVKDKRLVTCAECDDFPCEKYTGFFDWESFVTHKVCRPNIERIRKVGLGKWLAEQRQRGAMLENLLANYNEGRSRSFYCIATALTPLEMIEEALNQAKKKPVHNKADESSIKVKAKILKSVIGDLALKANIDLKLRKKPKKGDK